LNLSDALNPSDADLDARYQVSLPQFFGPMDLLLALIEQEELEITKIALAQVTDQYLEHIETLKQASPEPAEWVTPDALTDFLVVAARLVLLKSQTLLPKPPPSIISEDEEDSADDLIQQLKDYKRFKELASRLGEMQETGLRSFIRVAPPPKIEAKLTIGDVDLDDLLAAVRKVLEVKPEPPDVNSVVSPETITMGKQISLIRRKLAGSKQLSFDDLLNQRHSRIEVIVTLLAVLELLKRKIITVEQAERFGEITIVRLENAALSEDDWQDLTQMEDLS